MERRQTTVSNASIGNWSFRQLSDIGFFAEWRSEGLKDWIVDHDEFRLVLEFLDIPTIATLGKVCSEFRTRFHDNDTWAMVFQRDLSRVTIACEPHVPFPNVFYHPDGGNSKNPFALVAASLFRLEAIYDGSMPVATDATHFVPISDTVTFELKYFNLTWEEFFERSRRKPELLPSDIEYVEHFKRVAASGVFLLKGSPSTLQTLAECWCKGKESPVNTTLPALHEMCRRWLDCGSDTSKVAQEEELLSKPLWEATALYELCISLLSNLSNPYESMLKTYRLPTTFTELLLADDATAYELNAVLQARREEESMVRIDGVHINKNRLVGLPSPVFFWTVSDQARDAPDVVRVIYYRNRLFRYATYSSCLFLAALASQQLSGTGTSEELSTMDLLVSFFPRPRHLFPPSTALLAGGCRYAVASALVGCNPKGLLKSLIPTVLSSPLLHGAFVVGSVLADWKYRMVWPYARKLPAIGLMFQKLGDHVLADLVVTPLAVAAVESTCRHLSVPSNRSTTLLKLLAMSLVVGSRWYYTTYDFALELSPNRYNRPGFRFLSVLCGIIGHHHGGILPGVATQFLFSDIIRMKVREAYYARRSTVGLKSYFLK